MLSIKCQSNKVIVMLLIAASYYNSYSLFHYSILEVLCFCFLFVFVPCDLSFIFGAIWVPVEPRMNGEHNPVKALSDTDLSCSVLY